MLAVILTDSLAAINEANRRFWEQQRERFNERMNDDAIRETAFAAWQAQQVRAVPPVNQFSLEDALKDAEKSKKRFISELACKGGTARKADALQVLIEETVTRQPDISTNRLLERLEACGAVRHVVESIEDGTIIFATGSNKRAKEAKVSGLKHRLTRAKKTVRSR
jgi:hypothetical protein